MADKPRLVVLVAEPWPQDLEELISAPACGAGGILSYLLPFHPCHGPLPAQNPQEPTTLGLPFLGGRAAPWAPWQRSKAAVGRGQHPAEDVSWHLAGLLSVTFPQMP